MFLNVTNVIFTIIFTVELMAKVISNGLFFGPEAYVRSGWNTMDGLLVLISIIDLALMQPVVMTPTNPDEGTTRIFSMLRVFRLLRTLRPLRG